VDWPGISTAGHDVVSLTALSTVGSSRQNSRCCVFSGGRGRWLPYGDGLTSIHLALFWIQLRGSPFFLSLSPAFASWFMTSSPRLVILWRAGRRCFFASSISIHSQSRPSLSIARDRVVGILLGLIMMWLVFRSTIGSIRRLRHEEGVPFGGSIAGSICTRADLEGTTTWAAETQFTPCVRRSTTISTACEPPRTAFS